MKKVLLLAALAAVALAPAYAEPPSGGGCPPPLGRLIKAADADQNGEVTWDEFHAKFPNISEDRFNVLDRDDDNVLTKEDVPWHERARILRRLKQADTDGDNSVSLEEFQAEFPNADEAAFNRLDRNDDGAIDKNDCVNIDDGGATL